MRQEDLRREHEQEPVASRRRPLHQRQVSTRVLEQRALVDHRQLEVGVGVVDRLPARLGDHDQRERDGAERERRSRPGERARGSRDHPPQIGRAGHERSDGEREHERRLGEDREREVAARALQGEAVRDVPRRGAGGEPREREQAGEHESIVTYAEVGRSGGDGHEQDRRCHRRHHDHGRRAVDQRAAFDIDRALAPEPAQLAVGLQRSRSATALQAGLGLLCQADEQGRCCHASANLQRAGDERGPHPIAPRRTAASSASTSAIRYAMYVPSRPL